MRVRWKFLAAVGGIGLWLVGPVQAQETGEAPPAVDLDRLLKLPKSLELDTESRRRGGSTRSEWRAQFDEARAELDAARDGLKETQSELEEVSAEGGAWKMTAPGAPVSSSDQSPSNYRLSQELRRAREEVARAEHQLQELRIEANLSGVPPEWQSDGTPGSEEAPVSQR